MTDHENLRELLVVDDEPKLAGALKTFFEEKGFHVSTAGTALAALQQCQHLPPSVVLLDVKLPDGLGLDVLSRLKARQPNLRVIMISALTDPSTIHEALQRGASDYLTKPFNFLRCFYAAMGMETVELTDVQPTAEALSRVPVAVAQRHRVVPLKWSEGRLTIAMADPLDVQRLDELRTLLGCELRVVAAIGAAFEAVIHRCYGVGAGIVPRTDSHASSKPFEPPVEMPRATEISTGVVRLVSDLIQHAHANRATDLHVGIGPQGPWMRERVDGILYEIPLASEFIELYPEVLSRVKVMTDLDIAERRLPQDGRCWFEVGSARLDLRVSVLPTPHGENLAVRLLEPSQVLPLEQLGLCEAQCRQVESSLAKPTGLTLVAGPTGSGKSTSLYAFLSKLNTGRVNIVTIEDPIEHEMSGVTQIHVRPKVGLTFATGLRSILRHDPDIIMVGEIRDQETANLAVRAALTGHVVLSSLHTNDAAGGVTRLLDLGIEPFLLCSTLSGILSQRLVRVLCESCRIACELDTASLSCVGVVAPAEAEDRLRVWRPHGCARCRQTGYYGRRGLFELLTIDHHIRSLIIKRAPSAHLKQSATSRGMISLWQSGWDAVRSGLTSLEELVRVLPAELR